MVPLMTILRLGEEDITAAPGAIPQETISANVDVTRTEMLVAVTLVLMWDLAAQSDKSLMRLLRTLTLILRRPPA